MVSKIIVVNHGVVIYCFTGRQVSIHEIIIEWFLLIEIYGSKWDIV